MFQPFRFLAGTLLASLPATAFALTISPTSDAFGLANTLFLNTPGIALQSASLSTASTQQAGTYANASGTYGLPASGIVLSSGNVSDYADGSSWSSSNTTSYGVSASAAQQALLQPITGQSWHYDVAQLTIEFIPTVSSVTFFATFGSEEWPTYVGTSYIDGFGLYVNGTNVAGAVATGGGDTLAININHPDMTSIPGTELNAVLAPNGNPVLQFDVPVVAGQTNVFDIILADASDAQLDTTVYLSSFIPTPGGGPVDGDGTSEFTPILPSNPPDPVTGEFVIVLPDPPENTTIWIDPPVTTGYVYEVTGAEFATVTLPSLAAVADLDGYILTIGDDSFALAASTTFDFAAQGYSNVTSFVISGIDPDLGLDPADTQAFPIGVSLVDVAGDVAISITPVAAVDLPAVPAPATLPLLAGALAGFGFILRRKRSA